MPVFRRSSTHILLLALTILVGSACGGGGAGCTCLTPLTSGFPSAQRQVNAVQVRLSSSALTFIRDNAVSVASGVLGGSVMVFVIPPDCAGDMCCEDGSPDLCDVEIDLGTTFSDPPRLEPSDDPTAPSHLHAC